MRKSFHVRAGKVATAAIVAGSFFLFAGGASAAALTQSQISSILNLLQSFGVDQTTINNVQNVLTGTGTGTSTAPSQPSVTYPAGSATSTCATLSSTMGPGSSGEDVKQLQAFLAKAPGVYPEGIVSGYYGKLTEDAVKRWQAQQSIVATGTPQTTGYGEVGPHTKGAMDHQMEVECESGDNAGGQSADHASATSTEARANAGSDHASATSTWARDNQGNSGGDNQQTASSAPAQDN